jgi:hypothetical protein
LKLLILLIVFAISIPGSVICQDQEPEPEMKIDDALNSMLDTHPYRFSIFWVMPEVNITSGYDSNGLYAPSGEVIGDYFLSVSPGASVGLRFGTKAFLVIDQNVNFLYYNELEQLRDIFNRTSARFTTGSRRTLWSFYGRYVDRKTGVDSEFDVPVQQKTASGGADAEIGLGSKWDLGFHVYTAHNTYSEVVDSSLISLPPDYRNYRYGNSIRYNFHPSVSFIADANITRVEFLNQNNRQNDTFRVLGGLRLSSPGMKGHVRLGYAQTQTQRLLVQDDLKSFVGNAQVDFIFRERSTIGGFFRRDHDISRIGGSNFRITTEGGIRASFPIAKEVFGDASYSYAKNDYGERVDLEDITQLKDTVHTLQSGLNYHIVRDVILRGGIIYYDRDSNFRRVEKDRLVYDIGVRYFFNP